MKKLAVYLSTVAGEGRAPGRAHIMRIAEGTGIKKNQADEIMDEVASAVSKWQHFADEAGVSKATMMQIGSTLSL
jgi:serine/threonine-protein kinase HipA